MTTGLILSGGGARAAYQVGVLNAVADILPEEVYNPFPIVCGTSAGAINAMALAGRPGHFRFRIQKLREVWENIHTKQVYRADVLGVLVNSIKIFYSFFNRSYSNRAPLALLNNAPLRKLLSDQVSFQHIDEAVARGELQALGITAMNYHSGKSVTFYQGNRKIDPWHRARRAGKRVGLTLDHLMASSALPTLFPATKIDEHYYGDGALRLLKPISPALHLGADKVFVIGVSDNPTHQEDEDDADYPPSIGQVMGHVLNSVFIDSIEGDIESLKTINRLTKHLSEQERIDHGLKDLRPIDFLSISPSQAIDGIAKKYLKELPKVMRFFLYITGATKNGSGISVASYLLFEKGFCQELLDLGYQDAMNQKDEIKDFFTST